MNPPDLTKVRRGSDATVLFANRKRILSEINPQTIAGLVAERQPSGLQKKITEDFTSLEDEILGLKTPKAVTGPVATTNRSPSTNAKDDSNTRRYSSFSIVPIPSGGQAAAPNGGVSPSRSM